MTRWHFWGEKQFAEVYENIYIRARTEDWFGIVFGIVSEIGRDAKPGITILDVGCGEGHTTKQILDRMHTHYTCDLVEPDRNALAVAKAMLSPENHIRNAFAQTLATLDAHELYDVVFTSHTNYYWAFNERDYQQQLQKLLKLLKPTGKLLILTLPEKSDHYRIALREAYPPYTHAEYIQIYFRAQGLKVRTKRFRMRMYVGDILSTSNLYDLKNYYRFIHNTDTHPTDKEAKKFLRNIKKVEQNKYLDFKDELIVISQ